MTLKAELGKLERQLARLPADGGGKPRLSLAAWGWVAGSVPWDELNDDERADLLPLVESQPRQPLEQEFNLTPSPPTE